VKKTLLVLRHELVTILGRRTFLFAAFGVPLLAILISAGIAIVKSNSGNESNARDAEKQNELKVEGYVDRSGVIDTIPSEIPAEHLVAYADERQAKQALKSGEISAYYVVPKDFLGTGKIYYVYPDTIALKSDGQDWVIRRTLLLNLLDGNTELADRIWNPMNLEVTDLTPTPQDGHAAEARSSRLVRFLPAIMSVLFYVFLLTASNILLRNISSEKENRTIEILLLSIAPRQMLVGKIIGLGIASLLHTFTWVSTFLVVMRINGHTFNLSESDTLPASLLAWGLVFFMLGFAIYASLMAGVGALVPKLKEANHASSIAAVPLVIAYIVGLLAPLADFADGILPLVLSIFPLTAPITMMMRLTAGDVPLWQLLLSAGLMAATAYIIVRAVAAMFRAQHLLSGQAFSVGRFFGVLMGRKE
jgi:ABC-2 type transport system permease protein